MLDRPPTLPYPMAYNYSREFLIYNKAMLDTLRQLLIDERVVMLTVDDIKEGRKLQFFVRNLCKSAALYEPQNESAFNSIRTWTEYVKNQAKWNIYIGLPKHKVRGYQPGVALSKLSNAMMYQAAHGAPQGDLEEYPTVVSTEQDGNRLIDHCMQSKFMRIHVRFSGPVEDAQYWNAWRDLGWEPHFTEVNAITFVRKPITTTYDKAP